MRSRFFYEALEISVCMAGVWVDLKILIILTLSTCIHCDNTESGA